MPIVPPVIGLVLRSPAPHALGLSFAAAALLQTGMIAVLAKLLAIRVGASEPRVRIGRDPPTFPPFTERLP